MYGPILCFFMIVWFGLLMENKMTLKHLGYKKFTII
jgi:hypothetical protein